MPREIISETESVSKALGNISWEWYSPIIKNIEKRNRYVDFMGQIFHVFQCPNNTLKKVFRLILHKEI